MNNANAPAYPSHGSMGEVAYQGLTKREAFAMAAMQGCLASDREQALTQGQVVDWSIRLADAMLEELEK